MARVLLVALVAAAGAVSLGVGCGSDDGVLLRLLSKEVREDEPPKVVVGVFVTASCFFSVLLNGNLKASGRWDAGAHEVLIPGYLMLPQDNLVLIDVAGVDGSSARIEEPLGFCESGELVCGDVLPDPGPLCADCWGETAEEADAECGGPPNACVPLYGPDELGICGTYCGDDGACPAGFDCTYFSDDTHETWVCFPPPPDYSCS